MPRQPAPHWSRGRSSRSYAIGARTPSSTCVVRSSTSSAACSRRSRRRTPRGYAGQRDPRQRLRPRARLHAGAGAYIRGEETGAGRLRRCPPWPASAAPAVPRRRRAVRLTDGHQQRGVDRQRAGHRARRRRLVPLHGQREVRRLHAVLVVRPRQPAPASTRPRSASRCASSLDMAGGIRKGHSSSSGPPAGPPRRSSPTSTSTSRSTTRESAAAGSMLRHQGAADLRRDDVGRCARPCAGPSSTSTSRAASAPPAARARGGSSRCCTASRRARAPWPTSSRSSTSPTTWPAGRSARSRTAPPPASRARCSTSRTSSSQAPTHRPGSCSRTRPPPSSLERTPMPATSAGSDAAGPATRTDKAAGAGPAAAGGEVQPHVDLVRLTIDGFAVEVPKGTLVIRAAELLGIQVPRFCDHPLLDPVGACRQCLVEIALPNPRADGEVQKMPKPQATLHDHRQRGHGRRDPADLAGGRPGAARDDGVPPRQPPARLPGLRQGRRVSAAEPGDEQRSGRGALRRAQAHLPQADRHLVPGAPRPRALRAVRALHAVLQGDRR